MTAIVINIAGDYDGRDIERARKALGGLGDAANNNAFVAVRREAQGHRVVAVARSARRCPPT